MSRAGGTVGLPPPARHPMAVFGRCDRPWVARIGTRAAANELPDEHVRCRVLARGVDDPSRRRAAASHLVERRQILVAARDGAHRPVVGTLVRQVGAGGVPLPGGRSGYGRGLRAVRSLRTNERETDHDERDRRGDGENTRSRRGCGSPGDPAQRLVRELLDLVGTEQLAFDRPGCGKPPARGVFLTERREPRSTARAVVIHAGRRHAVAIRKAFDTDKAQTGRIRRGCPMPAAVLDNPAPQRHLTDRPAGDPAERRQVGWVGARVHAAGNRRRGGACRCRSQVAWNSSPGTQASGLVNDDKRGPSSVSVTLHARQPRTASGTRAGPRGERMARYSPGSGVQASPPRPLGGEPSRRSAARSGPPRSRRARTPSGRRRGSARTSHRPDRQRGLVTDLGRVARRHRPRRRTRAGRRSGRRRRRARSPTSWRDLDARLESGDVDRRVLVDFTASPPSGPITLAAAGSSGPRS